MSWAIALAGLGMLDYRSFTAGAIDRDIAISLASLVVTFFGTAVLRTLGRQRRVASQVAEKSDALSVALRTRDGSATLRAAFDLDRPVARVTEWPAGQHQSLDRVVPEVGSESGRPPSQVLGPAG